MGMVAVIRDIQEWVTWHQYPSSTIGYELDADALNAYLLAQLIVAGALDDGQG